MFNFQRTVNFDTTDTILLNFDQHFLNATEAQLSKTLKQLHNAVENDKNVIINCKDVVTSPDKNEQAQNEAIIKKTLVKIISNLMTPDIDDDLNKSMLLHFVNIPDTMKEIMKNTFNQQN